jgi:hypothetical protein
LGYPLRRGFIQRQYLLELCRDDDAMNHRPGHIMLFKNSTNPTALCVWRKPKVTLWT